MQHEGGALGQAAGEPGAVALPSASCRRRRQPSPGPTVSAHGQGAGQARDGRSQASGDRCVRPRWAGGPFRPQADVWSKRGRQTASPRSHLELGLGPPGARTPPPATAAPPTAAPIKFLPIKRPVFLPGKPCQQWSLGTRRGGGTRGLGLPANTAHKVNKTCAGQRLARARHSQDRALNSRTEASVSM